MIQFMIFITGLIIGSFLNVIIYRLPENESIVLPASHCPECGTRLKLIDLVPLLSYIWSKGRCRYCGQRISWQYPVVELMTGFLFSATYLKYGINTNFIILNILISTLIVISFIDLKSMIIPNKITYPGIITGFISALFLNHISFVSSLIGLLIPGGFLLLIALVFKKGMGIGDVKLVAMIGAFIGWECTLLGIFIGSLVGAVTGLILLVTGVIGRRTRIPFAPLISIGTIITIFFGDEIISLYLNLFI